MEPAEPRKLVRVTGERNGNIEFEYGVGDLSLAIELLLPPAAFEEFCTANAVQRVCARSSGRGVRQRFSGAQGLSVRTAADDRILHCSTDAGALVRAGHLYRKVPVGSGCAASSLAAVSRALNYAIGITEG